MWSWLGRKTIHVLFTIHVASRRIEITGVTDRPNEAFMQQVARNGIMDEVGFLRRIGAHYLIHDRDTKFCAAWKRVLRDGGVEPLAIPANSPNLNAFAERWVRTVKRECLRKVHLLGMGGLRRVLSEYVDNYNRARPHQGLDNRTPDAVACGTAAPQKVETGPLGEIRCRTRCGGVIREYFRAAA